MPKRTREPLDGGERGSSAQGAPAWDLTVTARDASDLEALRERFPEDVDFRTFGELAIAPEDSRERLLVISRPCERSQVKRLRAAVTALVPDVMVPELELWGADEPLDQWLTGGWVPSECQTGGTLLAWLLDLPHVTPDPVEATSTGPPWEPLRLRSAPDPAPFPMDVLPSRTAGFVEQVYVAKRCPPDFPGVHALAVASGAIGRSCSLLLKSDYFASASLYIANVGLVSDGKSPSLRAGMAPIVEIDKNLQEAYSLAYQQWLDSGPVDAKGNKKKPETAQPIPERIHAGNFTLEALFRVLATNERGIISTQDELAGMMGTMNQYRSGGKGADLDLLLSFWSGIRTVIDRVNLGPAPLVIPHPFLTLCGGIQVDRLRQLGFEQGNGWVERFLFCCPAPRPVAGWSEAGVEPFAADGWEQTIRTLWGTPMDLRDGYKVPHTLFMSNAAREAFRHHHDALVHVMNGPQFNARLRGCYGKLTEYLGRLALVLNRLWLADSGEVHFGNVGVHDVERAATLIRYFTSHAERVHALAMGAHTDPQADRILDWIRRHHKTEFKRSQVRSDLKRSLTDEEIDKALDSLEVSNAIRPKNEPFTPRAGRKASPSYEVHPEVLKAPVNPFNPRNDPGADSDRELNGFLGYMGATKVSGNGGTTRL